MKWAELRNHHTSDDFARLGLSYAAKEIAQSLLITTFLMALSAVAFARLTGFPAVGVPGASKTPELLAEAFELAPFSRPADR